MNTPDLLVLGDCNPDLILSGGVLEPRFGQVETLVEGAELTIGGSGSIVACGAARLGLKTALVAVVGDDLFGRFMTTELSARGVDTSQVEVDSTLKTGLTVILDRGSDRAMLTFPGTIATLDPQTTAINARHVHVSSYFMQTKLQAGLLELLQHAKAAGVSTSIDPNWDPSERWDSGLLALLPYVDVFLPNAEEAMRIAERSDPAAAAHHLASHGALVVVKLGQRGAIAVAPDGTVTQASPPSGTVDPVDTIGAGDSFDAGFLTARLNGWSTERALALACACGGLSTRASGGTAAQPTLEEAFAALRDALGDLP